MCIRDSNKTETVILTKKRIALILPLCVREVIMETNAVAKYFGVLIDMKIYFFHKIRHSADKTAKGVTTAD